jgi:RNA polymerase sigma-70 factor, ECF subfamily
MSTLCIEAPLAADPDLPIADASDREDMLALAHGDGAALNSLMERHSPRLYHYLLRQLHDENDAQDLAQETFVRIYEHANSFDGRKKFTTWMYTIATNLVKDRFRYLSRHPATSLDRLAEETDDRAPKNIPDSRAANPSDAAERAERARAVQQAIASLPQELKTSLILSTYQDLSHAEIAQILSCSTKAVEVRIYRARQQLRTLLQNLFDDAPATLAVDT